MSDVADKAKHVALEESKRLSALSKSAAKSGAWFYPIRVCLSFIVQSSDCRGNVTNMTQGIFYFAFHRSLW